jgi:hypothetical protein
MGPIDHFSDSCGVGLPWWKNPVALRIKARRSIWKAVYHPPQVSRIKGIVTIIILSWSWFIFCLLTHFKSPQSFLFCNVSRTIRARNYNRIKKFPYLYSFDKKIPKGMITCMTLKALER